MNSLTESIEVSETRACEAFCGHAVRWTEVRSSIEKGGKKHDGEIASDAVGIREGEHSVKREIPRDRPSDLDCVPSNRLQGDRLAFGDQAEVTSAVGHVAAKRRRTLRGAGGRGRQGSEPLASLPRNKELYLGVRGNEAKG